MNIMKKFIHLIVILVISTATFGQTQVGTSQIKDNAITTPKISAGSVTEAKLAADALRPVSGGALSNGVLTFDEHEKTHTLAVTSDIALSLAGSGNVQNSRIYLTATGDGIHTLTWPSDWKVTGAYDPVATNEIEINYRGSYTKIEIVQTTAIVLSALTTAVVLEAAPDDAVLTFDNPVTITSTGWSLTGSAGAVTISSVSGSGTTTPTFDLSRDIEADEVLTISYNPATGSTTSLTGNEITTIAAFPVTTWEGAPPPADFCDITVCSTGGDYTTGQAASDAAVAGQTICFCAGTYRETIVGKTGVTYRNIPGDVAI